MDIIGYLEITPIELLGYSKNNIVETKVISSALPQEYDEKLSQAYTLIDEVQEYLYCCEDISDTDDLVY